MTERARTTAEPPKAVFDERKIARLFAIGLPVVTVVAATAVGLATSAPIAILVLSAGVILGVIALFWASLRVLSGDAPLSAELEALEASQRGVPALVSRKKMLLRALKDLDNERAVGKLDEADFEQVSGTYRDELRRVLAEIDETAAPHRARAEELARAHLERAGLAAEAEGDAASDAEGDADDASEAPAETDGTAPAPETDAERRRCAACEASNEPDAKFCKGCGSPLSAAAPAVTSEEQPSEA